MYLRIRFWDFRSHRKSKICKPNLPISRLQLIFRGVEENRSCFVIEGRDVKFFRKLEHDFCPNWGWSPTSQWSPIPMTSPRFKLIHMGKMISRSKCPKYRHLVSSSQIFLTDPIVKSWNSGKAVVIFAECLGEPSFSNSPMFPIYRN